MRQEVSEQANRPTRHSIEKKTKELLRNWIIKNNVTFVECFLYSYSAALHPGV